MKLNFLYFKKKKKTFMNKKYLVYVKIFPATKFDLLKVTIFKRNTL